MPGEADRLKKENEELRQLLLTAPPNARSEEVWKPALEAYQKVLAEEMRDPEGRFSAAYAYVDQDQVDRRPDEGRKAKAYQEMLSDSERALRKLNDESQERIKELEERLKAASVPREGAAAAARRQLAAKNAASSRGVEPLEVRVAELERQADQIVAAYNSWCLMRDNQEARIGALENQVLRSEAVQMFKEDRRWWRR